MWWGWLLVDVGIALVAIIVTAVVAVGTVSRTKRVARRMKEIKAQVPKLEVPHRS